MEKMLKTKRMGLIVYNRYKQLARQLEPLRNENWIKRFQDLAFPAYLDK